jgi:hypothetical protein
MMKTRTRVVDGGWMIEWRSVVAILHPLFSILALLSLSGCYAVGAVAYKVAGPPPVEAKYVPKKVPMLVVVENYSNPSATQVDAQRVADAVTETFRRRDIAPMIDADVLQSLRDADPAKVRRMTIPQVGAATKAYQVLYVDLQDVDLDADGYPVASQTKWARVDEQRGDMDVRTALVRDMSDQIAKLFYKWTPEY